MARSENKTFEKAVKEGAPYESHTIPNSSARGDCIDRDRFQLIRNYSPNLVVRSLLPRDR